MADRKHDEDMMEEQVSPDAGGDFGAFLRQYAEDAYRLGESLNGDEAEDAEEDVAEPSTAGDEPGGSRNETAADSDGGIPEGRDVKATDHSAREVAGRPRNGGGGETPVTEADASIEGYPYLPEGYDADKDESIHNDARGASRDVGGARYEVPDVKPFEYTETERAIPYRDDEGRPAVAKSYGELIEALYGGQHMTREEREREVKRQKRNMLMAAIGDGLSALANLWFTTKGAPNMYDATKGMTEKVRERYDKVKKERDALEREYAKFYMEAVKADDLWRKRDYESQLKAWKETATQAFKAVEAKQKADKAYLDGLLAEGKITKSQYEALLAKAKIKTEEVKQRVGDADVDLKKAQKSKTETDAEVNRKVGNAKVNNLNQTGAAAMKNANTNEKKANKETSKYEFMGVSYDSASAYRKAVYTACGKSATMVDNYRNKDTGQWNVPVDVLAAEYEYIYGD